MNQFKDDESVQNDNHGKEMNKMMNQFRMRNFSHRSRGTMKKEWPIGGKERYEKNVNEKKGMKRM